MPRRPRQSGYTLMECLLASTILAISVIAIAQAVSTGQRETSDSLRELRALELAQAMMNEIVAQPYLDASGNQTIGPPTGISARINFTGAGNYSGLKENPGSIADINGTLYPSAYQVFTRSVTCNYTTLSISGLGTLQGMSAVVTITDNRKRTWTLTRFIQNPGS